MDEMRETLNIEAERKPDYDRLCKALGGVENKVAFLVAMTHGSRNDSRMQIKKKVSYVRTSYLNEQDRALVAAVALAHGLSESEFSWDRALTIAEEYSRGGMVLLRGDMEALNEFAKSFPLDVIGAAPEPTSASPEQSPENE
jgi:hypothetical protein